MLDHVRFWKFIGWNYIKLNIIHFFIFVSASLVTLQIPSKSSNNQLDWVVNGQNNFFEVDEGNNN